MRGARGNREYTVLLRQSDYQPVSLTVDWMPPGAEPHRYEYTISTWETVARDNVPAGTFDPDTVQDPDADQIQESYAPDDPRLEAFDRFPAWRLAEGSELGPIMGGRYDWCDYSDFIDQVGYEPLGGSGKLTVEYHYAYGSGSDRTVAVVDVTTYPSAESRAVDDHWDMTLMGRRRVFR